MVYRPSPVSSAMINLPLILGCLSLGIPAVFSGESTTWDQFLASKESGSVPILPDYSYAGYGLGEHSIPSARGPVFEVTAYGAVPDDGENDRSAIEETIRAAEAAGAVYTEYDWWSSRRGEEDYSGAKVVNPIIIGLHGLPTTFRQDHCGIIESLGSAVEPDSLFEAQLRLRLGRLPDWITRAREQSRFYEQNGFFEN